MPALLPRHRKEAAQGSCLALSHREGLSMAVGAGLGRALMPPVCLRVSASIAAVFLGIMSSWLSSFPCRTPRCRARFALMATLLFKGAGGTQRSCGQQPPGRSWGGREAAGKGVQLPRCCSLTLLPWEHPYTHRLAYHTHTTHSDEARCSTVSEQTTTQFVQSLLWNVLPTPLLIQSIFPDLV